MFVIISKNKTHKATEDFKYSEFFTHSSVPIGFEHDIDFKLIIAAQILRTWTGVPWHISSSFRTPSEQEELVLTSLGSPVSQHLYGRALDLQPVDEAHRLKWIPLIHEQIEKRGNLFHELRHTGINGFGLYDTFIHIDTRQKAGLHKDALGTFGYWDYRVGQAKKKTS